MFSFLQFSLYWLQQVWVQISLVFILFRSSCASWLCRFMSFTTYVDIFSYDYFKYFPSLCFSLFFWNSDNINVRSFGIIP
jgi:hypothetical protein